MLAGRSSKAYVVTGPTSGIGYQTALELAARSAYYDAFHTVLWAAAVVLTAGAIWVSMLWKKRSGDIAVLDRSHGCRLCGTINEIAGRGCRWSSG